MLRPNKITIVGAETIGMSCAVALLSKKLTCHLTLIDQNEAKVIGEALDLLQASIYMNNVKILAGKDYSLTSKSVLCIVTSLVEQQPDELEIDFLNRYVEIYKWILPNLVKYSPNTIILLVGNPIGVLTFAAWKITGLPKNRIIGVASSLDTLTFRNRVAVELEIAAANIIGWSIGENALLSSLSVAGTKLNELETSDLDVMKDSTEQNQPNKIFQNWTIALNCAEIAAAIIKNSTKIFSVAACAKGHFEIDGNVFLTLPCLIDRNGITNIVKLSLSDAELQLLDSPVAKLEKLNLKISL